MKTKVIFTSYQFDEKGIEVKKVIKEKSFKTKQDAREYIDLLKNRWRNIWGWRKKANFWYANKTMAYVAFNKSYIEIQLKKI